ncbi:MAG: DCC1-like thiol-disulfide oxidoreductase family protein [Pseudomonadota bacterium]
MKIIYNSVCPVCREGICYFERRAAAPGSPVDYIDIAADPAAFAARGVGLDDVRRKLHALLPDGSLVKGWPAVSALWRRQPGYAWLARLGDAPGLRWIAGGLYAAAAQILWWWNRASGRW